MNVTLQVVVQASGLRLSQQPFGLLGKACTNKPKACWDRRKPEARATT